jgi:sulfide:quinone oxidoreductase
MKKAIQMDIRKISNDLSAGPQILPSDVAELKQLGFRSIIVNRPDGEGDNQPPFAAIETAANNAGMETTYIPVVPGQLTDDHISLFSDVVETYPKPIFAFCRTGTRAATLWSLCEGVKGRPFQQILKATKAAGYDMSELESRIAASNASCR